MKSTKNLKRNAVVATVLLFICAGIYLNWSYNQNMQPTDLTSTLNMEKVMDDSSLVLGNLGTDASHVAANPDYMSDYFASVRLSRQETRDEMLSLLQETMAYEDGTEETSTCSATLEALVSDALAESQIESLVIAKGFEDCVTYMSDGICCVAVATPAEGLSQSDVALISDVVTSQSAYELSDIRVIEVK